MSCQGNVNAEEFVTLYRPRAVCVEKTVEGKTYYRISPYPNAQKDFLSKWCSTRSNAWRAALQHLAVRMSRTDPR